MGTILDLREHGGADAYLRDCPSRTVLDVLADKWTTLIIGALGAEPRRFGELRRRLGGITQKMLSQSLRSLERNGLVKRTVYPTVPPRVDYALTDLGRSVLTPLETIRVWAETHIDNIADARASYDERATHQPEPIEAGRAAPSARA